MRLSPRGLAIGTCHVIVGDAEISLGHFDAAIDAYRQALDMSLEGGFFAHTNLAAAYAHAGKMDEAKAEVSEARRLNPAITVKWMKEHTPHRDPSRQGRLLIGEDEAGTGSSQWIARRELSGSAELPAFCAFTVTI